MVSHYSKKINSFLQKKTQANYLRFDFLLFLPEELLPKSEPRQATGIIIILYMRAPVPEAFIPKSKPRQEEANHTVIKSAVPQRAPQGRAPPRFRFTAANPPKKAEEYIEKKQSGVINRWGFSGIRQTKDIMIMNEMNIRIPIKVPNRELRIRFFALELLSGLLFAA